MHPDRFGFCIITSKSIDIQSQIVYNTLTLVRGEVVINYLRVPSSVTTNQELGEKRILVYTSSMFLSWTSAEELAQQCGFFPDRHNRGTGKQFSDCLTQLQNLGYIRRGNFGAYQMEVNEGFGIITFDEFAKILEYRANASGRINHAHMFLLLAHVRQFMHKQRPRYYSNLFKRISTELGISQRAVSIAAKNLETAGILHCEELPRYKTNNQWHTNVHIFVDLKGSNDYDWHIEMEAGINQIRRTSKREN